MDDISTIYSYKLDKAKFSGKEEKLSMDCFVMLRM